MSKKTSNHLPIAIAALFLTIFIFPQISLPLILAMIISLALLTPVKWLESKGVHSFISAFIMMLIPMVLLVGVGAFYTSQFGDFFDSFSDLNSSSNENVEEVAQTLEDTFSINLADLRVKVKQNFMEILRSGSDVLGSTFSAFTTFFSWLILVPIYVIFMLLSRRKIVHFTKDYYPQADQKYIINFYNEARIGMLNYFRGLGFVVLIVGCLNTLGLLVLGIEYAFLLGTFSALLIVIPYVGVFLGAVIPIAVAFITKDSLVYPLAVMGLYALIQFLEGNLITPKLMSGEVNLNPLAIIVFLVLMGALGGVLGLIVAVPLLTLFKVALSNNPTYSSWAILLEYDSDEKKEA